MQAHSYIKNCLLTGLISLSLASCGGGGGGGGDSADNSYTGGSQSSPDENTLASVTSPAGLSVGQTITVTAVSQLGEQFNMDNTYRIASLTSSDGTKGRLSGYGSWTYTKTGTNTAEFSIEGSTGNSSVIYKDHKFTYTLQFTDNQSGKVTHAELYDSEDGSQSVNNYGTFTMTGRTVTNNSASNSSPGNSDSNAGASNTPTSVAPASLPVGKVFVAYLPEENNAFITCNYLTSGDSYQSLLYTGLASSYEYKADGSSAVLKMDVLQLGEEVYTLHFDSSTSGTGSIILDGMNIKFSFRLADRSEISTSTPPDNDSSDSEDSSDSGSADDKPSENNGDAVYGWAPESISSKVLELKSATDNVGRLGFDSSAVVLSPVGATCQYSYKRLGDGKARVTISGYYSGTLELQFISETEIQVKGSIGSNSVESQATLTPGSVSSDEFISPEGGWAPESVEGTTMTFLHGNPMKFGEGGYGTYSGGGWHSLEYTYEKTGDNTAVISGWYSQFSSGHNFSYTIKFISPTNFIWSGWSEFDERYAPIYGYGKDYYSNEEGTYKP